MGFFSHWEVEWAAYGSKYEGGERKERERGVGRTDTASGWMTRTNGNGVGGAKTRVFHLASTIGNEYLMQSG